jgi:hypothetical protein
MVITDCKMECSITTHHYRRHHASGPHAPGWSLWVDPFYRLEWLRTSPRVRSPFTYLWCEVRGDTHG